MSNGTDWVGVGQLLVSLLYMLGAMTARHKEQWELAIYRAVMSGVFALWIMV